MEGLTLQNCKTINIQNSMMWGSPWTTPLASVKLAQPTESHMHRDDDQDQDMQPNITAKKVGVLFWEYMKDNGTTQAEVAKRARKTTYSVNRVLRGSQKADAEEWVELAEAACVPLELLGTWFFSEELAEEGERYWLTKDEPGAYQLSQKVNKITSAISVANSVEEEEAVLLDASEELNWTPGAAAFIGHYAITKHPAMLPWAIYLYGRVLQDRDLPFRAQWALENAKLIAGRSSTLTPYVQLSLANLSVERGQIEEGQGIFNGIRRLHELGVRVLKVPRQLAHLYGFGTEADILYDIDVMPEKWNVEPTLSQYETDLTNAIAAANNANRPTWDLRFSATRGLVRVGRGDVEQGIKAISTSVKAFKKNDRSPAAYEVGSYSMALHYLAYILAKLPIPKNVESDFEEAKHLANLHNISVTRRVCKLATKLAPVVMALILFVIFWAPSIAQAGNGCTP